ncbi:MAG: hypothetical protein LUE29_03560 [Lachnospiraceae bacterium]|nr:hypothetical protein [Lachnospiraceae bacterium]
MDLVSPLQPGCLHSFSKKPHIQTRPQTEISYHPKMQRVEVFYHQYQEQTSRDPFCNKNNNYPEKEDSTKPARFQLKLAKILNDTACRKALKTGRR